MNDEIPISDQVSAEIDRRKIQKLIDEGKIDPEQLRNAPIVELKSPPIPFGPPDAMNIKSVTCNWQGDCGRILSTLEEFEEHLALDHFGYTKTEQ